MEFLKLIIIGLIIATIASNIILPKSAIKAMLHEDEKKNTDDNKPQYIIYDEELIKRIVFPFYFQESLPNRSDIFYGKHEKKDNEEFTQFLNTDILQTFNDKDAV